ncbi:MAG: HisA/HisF-related TIM barrel protein, partial [Halobacteria archaeon]|nr:HisA/HisF-related TIM barrel protein [Halobacteria archaeon]
MVSLDSSGGEVVVEGWTKGSGFSPVELAERFEEMGAESILFTNVDKEGLREGVDPEPVEELVSAVRIPVIASG